MTLINILKISPKIKCDDVDRWLYYREWYKNYNRINDL